MITFALMLKLTGGALLFVALGAYTLNAKKRDTQRLLRISSQIAFVRFVRERIDRYLLPVGEILRECGDNMWEGIFIGCQAETDVVDIDSMRHIIRHSLYYSDGGDIFDSFLAHLGSSYREDEVDACDRCISELSGIEKRLSEELPRERKSRAILAFCLAAAVIIILI